MKFHYCTLIQVDIIAIIIIESNYLLLYAIFCFWERSRMNFMFYYFPCRDRKVVFQPQYATQFLSDHYIYTRDFDYSAARTAWHSGRLSYDPDRLGNFSMLTEHYIPIAHGTFACIAYCYTLILVCRFAYIFLCRQIMK